MEVREGSGRLGEARAGLCSCEFIVKVNHSMGKIFLEFRTYNTDVAALSSGLAFSALQIRERDKEHVNF